MSWLLIGVTKEAVTKETVLNLFKDEGFVGIMSTSREIKISSGRKKLKRNFIKAFDSKFAVKYKIILLSLLTFNVQYLRFFQFFILFVDYLDLKYNF
jgi:hypothetical protein